jgi:hypothetical protein
VKSDMPNIIRQKRKANYTVIPNEMLNNPELSFKAKAILCYLLSKPDKWSVYLSQLAKASTDGYESVVSGMNELIANRYVFRKPCSGANPGGWEYFVYDEPQSDEEFPLVDSPTREITDSGKPTTNKERLDKVSKEIKEKTESTKRKPKLVDDAFITQLKRLNPDKDVDKEVQMARTWILAKPERQFTQQFLSGWINRSTNTVKPEKLCPI